MLGKTRPWGQLWISDSSCQFPTLVHLPAPPNWLSASCLGARVFCPALQPFLARKPLSAFRLGWDRVSSSTNCGASRRSWEEAAERKIIA